MEYIIEQDNPCDKYIIEQDNPCDKINSQNSQSMLSMHTYCKYWMACTVPKCPAAAARGA